MVHWEGATRLMLFRFPVVASDGREQENKTLPLHLWDQTQKEVESDILWINIYKNCKRNQYYFLAIISVVPFACQFYFTSNYSSKGQAFFRAKWAPWGVELLNGKFGVLAFNQACYWHLLSISSRLKRPTWQLVNQLLESLQWFDRVLDLGHLDEDGVHLEGEQRVWRFK